MLYYSTRYYNNKNMTIRGTVLCIKTDDSVKEFYENRKQYIGDAGFDLFCPEDMHVEPGETVWINFGIKCEMKTISYPAKNNPVYRSYDLRPRSSISKTNLRLANSIGTIDSGYRGYIIAALDNIKSTPWDIKRGDRLVQLCLPDLLPFTYNYVDSLSNTERGEGGFGSTGK